MADVAAISVVTSAAVAVLVPLGVETLRTRQSKAADRNARLDELRSVIDDAVVALIAVMDAMPQLEEIDEGIHKVREALPRLRGGLFAIWHQEARLAARVGLDAPLVEAYKRAHAKLGEMHTQYIDWLDDPSTTLTFGVANETEQLGRTLGVVFAEAAALIGPDRRRPAVIGSATRS